MLSPAIKNKLEGNIAYVNGPKMEVDKTFHLGDYVEIPALTLTFAIIECGFTVTKVQK